jgi:hypothetical protein
VKRHVRPIVRSALDRAQEALEEEGISYDTPKRAIVWAVKDHWPHGGYSLDEQRFELHIRQSDLQHRKVASLEGDLAVVGMHELLHCIRQERTRLDPMTSTIERIASEGVAYAISERGARFERKPLVKTKFNTVDNPGMLRMVRDADRRDMLELERELDDDAKRMEEEEFSEKWFEGYTIAGVAIGEAVGMKRVEERLDRGEAPNDLVSMPANRLLGTRRPARLDPGRQASSGPRWRARAGIGTIVRPPLDHKTDM